MALSQLYGTYNNALPTFPSAKSTSYTSVLLVALPALYSVLFKTMTSPVTLNSLKVGLALGYSKSLPKLPLYKTTNETFVEFKIFPSISSTTRE